MVEDERVCKSAILVGGNQPTITLLWSEMLDDDAFQWSEGHGGLTRANGDRFRQIVLSRGNTEDLAKTYVAWLGVEPSLQPMLKYRGLLPEGSGK